MPTYRMSVLEERGPSAWTITRLTADYRFVVPPFAKLETAARAILARTGFTPTADRMYRTNEAILGIGYAASPHLLDIVPEHPDTRVCARIRTASSIDDAGVTLTTDEAWWRSTYTHPQTHHAEPHRRMNGFRLQEAMQNADGSMDEPHWDAWFPRDGHLAIDTDEVVHLTSRLGHWCEAFAGDAAQRDGDGRPGYRRIMSLV